MQEKDDTDNVKTGDVKSLGNIKGTDSIKVLRRVVRKKGQAVFLAFPRLFLVFFRELETSPMLLFRILLTQILCPARLWPLVQRWLPSAS